MRLLLRVVDSIALLVSIFAAIGLIGLLVGGAVFNAWEQMRFMWKHSDEKIALIVAAIAVAWCALRWKQLNK